MRILLVVLVLVWGCGTFEKDDSANSSDAEPTPVPTIKTVLLRSAIDNFCPDTDRICFFEKGTALHYSDGRIIMEGGVQHFKDGDMMAYVAVPFGCNASEPVCTAFLNRNPIAAATFRDLWLIYKRAEDSYYLVRDGDTEDRKYSEDDVVVEELEAVDW